MSIYEAEVLRILKVGEYLVQNKTKNKNILVCTDSEATFKSLRKDLSESHLVQNCSNVLNDLAEDNKVTIKWVPAHEGIEGNEETEKDVKSNNKNWLRNVRSVNNYLWKQWELTNDFDETT